MTPPCQFSVAPPNVAEEGTCRVEPSVDFLDFSMNKWFLWQNSKTSKLLFLLKGEKVSCIARHNRAKFGIHLKSGFGVTVCNRIFTVLLYIVRWGRLAGKHPLISVNRDFIHDFFCQLRFGMLYIFMRSEETLKKWKIYMWIEQKFKTCFML